jgi:hypothetical protein
MNLSPHFPLLQKSLKSPLLFIGYYENEKFFKKKLFLAPL